MRCFDRRPLLILLRCSGTERYANGAYEGEDDIGRLMSDFRARNPDEMHFSLLADHVREMKSNQKGVMEMSSVLEEMCNKGIDIGCNKGHVDYLFRIMLRNGWSLEQAMDCVGLSPEEKTLYEPLVREKLAKAIS